MYFKSRKFIAVCSISSLLMAGLVSAGFAESERGDSRGR